MTDLIEQEETNDKKGLTLEQKLARKQDEMASLKARVRKKDTGQKVIIGGMMLSLSRKEIDVAIFLLHHLKGLEKINKANFERVDTVIDELQAIVNNYNIINQSQDNPAH